MANGREGYDELLAKDPRNGTALILLADWQLTDGDVANSIKNARAATAADGTSTFRRPGWS